MKDTLAQPLAPNKGSVLEYFEIGEIQINGSLDMYKLNNFICALTLAGAANQLLYELIKDNKGQSEPAFVKLKKILKENFSLTEEDEAELSLPRNALKHYMDSFCDRSVSIKEYSEIELCLAIKNYEIYTDKITGRMAEFVRNIQDKEQQ